MRDFISHTPSQPAKVFAKCFEAHLKSAAGEVLDARLRVVKKESAHLTLVLQRHFTFEAKDRLVFRDDRLCTLFNPKPYQSAHNMEHCQEVGGEIRGEKKNKKKSRAFL